MLNCKTGISAFGYILIRIDQVPWSSPHYCLSNLTLNLDSFYAIYCASYGFPGAGYYTWCNFLGNPPKSWIVLGCYIAVTYIPLVSQWAEIHSIALGFGITYASLFQF